jgi:hypothetical protein
MWGRGGGGTQVSGMEGLSALKTWFKHMQKSEERAAVLSLWESPEDFSSMWDQLLAQYHATKASQASALVPAPAQPHPTPHPGQETLPTARMPSCVVDTVPSPAARVCPPHSAPLGNITCVASNLSSPQRAQTAAVMVPRRRRRPRPRPRRRPRPQRPARWRGRPTRRGYRRCSVRGWCVCRPAG